MRILLLDVETAPNLAYVWGIWEQNVGLNQLMASDYMLCWAAKWLDEKTVFFSSRETNSEQQMLEPLHKLMEEADAIVHYNGKRFDIPWINREFIMAGFEPPSPYKQIDLLETVKRQFKFPSNKLDYISKALGVGEKVKHVGFELWLGCIRNDPEAWKQIQTYNIGDVTVLENLYLKVRPWIKGHANHSLHNIGALVCPRCGSQHHHKRGVTHTLASTYQRYQCLSCGGWFKDNIIINRKEYKTSEIV